MECKNCENLLRTDYNYCSFCGAKVIQNRITLKSLWYDVTERFLNVDNTFFKTFTHLFSKPEVVIGGYIDGVRKKYLNPVSYITIALTLTGFLIIFIRKTFPDGIDFDIFNTGVYNRETSKRLTDFSLTFYSLNFLMYIPILAFCGWLLYNSRKLNFTEYIVAFIYLQAQYSLFSIPITILVLFLLPEAYMTYSFIGIVLMVSYAMYVLHRLAPVKKGEAIVKAVGFLSLFSMGFVFLGIVQAIMMLVTGTLTLEDFAPKK